MNLLFRTSITIISLFLYTNLIGQPFIRSNDIEVRVNERSIKYPWAGGLNSPQFSNADINEDGIKDLVIFDRKDDQFLTFVSKGTPGEIDFEYDPVYEYNFPQSGNWALLVDYNCDGIKDLFSSLKKPDNFNRVTVHTGYYERNELKFGEPDTLVFTNEAEEKERIYVPLFDVPGIQDIDDDGDIDLLTFNIAGGYMEYYKNLSVENTGECGGLDFVLEDACFGKFYESGLVESIRLSENPDSCASRTAKHEQLHPGSTILAIDIDEDNDKDLFLGDISFNNLNQLTNGGDLNHAWMVEQDTMFPSYNTPVFFNYFPGAYYVDVNHDNVRDFIASPNGLNNAVNVNCSWLYINEGADNKLIARFQQNNFLVGEMIDVGEQSKPVFFDYDADGLLDLIVSNAGYYEKDGFSNQLSSALTLFKNVGSINTPIYELTSRDFANLAEEFGFKDMHPAFGDLDGDGDQDMLLGDSDGYVHYFTNNATSGQTANFSLTRGRFSGIDANQFATPFLYDLTENGLLDLVIGTSRGDLYYYQNTGTKEVPNYELMSDFWGAVKVNEVGETSAFTYPVLIELGENKELTLLVGSESGKIFAFNNIKENLNEGAFNLIHDDFLKEQVGKFSAFAIANIDEDATLEMIVGNFRGGLTLFNEDMGVAVDAIPKSKNLNVFPNPIKDWVQVETGLTEASNLQIINSVGQLCYQQTFEGEIMLKTSSFLNGLYILKIWNKKNIQTAKIIIQH